MFPFSIGASSWDTVKSNLVDLFKKVRAAIGKPENAGKSDSRPLRPVSPAMCRVPVSAASEDLKQRRIDALLAERGPAYEGSGGSNHTISVCNAVLVGMICTEDETFDYLRAWNAACVPPWSEPLLRRKINESRKLGGEPGYLLNADRPRYESAEELTVRARAFTIVVGNVVEVYGNGWAPLASQVARISPPPLPALEDIESVSLHDGTTDGDEGATEDAPRHDYCPHCHTIMAKHKKTGKHSLIYPPCRELACEWCGERYLAEKTGIVDYHLGRWMDASAGGGAPPLYLFTCSPDQWPKHARRIRKQQGEYFNVDVYALGRISGGTYLVLSTIAPKNIEVRIVTAERGREVMRRAIARIDRSCKLQWFRHSRDWGNPFGGDKGTGEFEILRKISSTRLAQARVLAEYGIQTEKAQTVSAGWKTKILLFWAGSVDLDNLAEDLSAGYIANRTPWDDTAYGPGNDADAFDFVGDGAG